MTDPADAASTRPTAWWRTGLSSGETGDLGPDTQLPTWARFLDRSMTAAATVPAFVIDVSVPASDQALTPATPVLTPVTADEAATFAVTGDVVKLMATGGDAEPPAGTADGADPVRIGWTASSGQGAGPERSGDLTVTFESAGGDSAPQTVPAPAGAGTVQAGHTDHGKPDADWRRTLTGCFEPLIATARADLAAAGHSGPVAEQFLDRLGARLLNLSLRTLVLELNQARERDELAGATSAERFADFAHRLAGGSELAALLATYPVLARILGETCRQGVDGQLELLARLDDDRAVLVETLLDGRDPGELTGVDPGGDPHRGGRATAMLTFADGRQLVYKPRPLDLHAHFNELVDWLAAKAGLTLRTAPVLARSGYGWLGFVPHLPCADLAGVHRFYHRQGALLALLYAVDGADMHYENLIAAGDQPVLVDVETLFHPDIAPLGAVSDDPAHAALVGSVFRTALLPLLASGDHGAVDQSGLGGDAGETTPNDVVDWDDAGLDTMHLVRRPGTSRGARNRPVLNGVPAEPRDHEVALLRGFRAAYEAIVWNRGELLGPDGLLARCADDEIRYLSRSTGVYAKLLDEATHPTALRDAAQREEVLGLLWDADVTQRPLVPHELAELWIGEIPLFTSRPGSRDVQAADGSRVTGFLGRTGLAAVEAKIAAMSDLDQHRQNWLVRACLATRPEPVVHGGTAYFPSLGVTEADPDHLLAAATDLADEIMAQVFGTLGGPANWLGLELLDDHHWAVLPMGAGLTNGYTGTALFLAQAGVITETAKYRELAYDAIRPIPRVLDVLAAELETAQIVGPGLHGLGGIAWGLDRLSTLLGDSEAAHWRDQSLELMERLRPEPEVFPAYGDGTAGGLAATLAVPGETAARLARRYADELVDVVEAGHLAPDSGFTRGYAGVAWALGRYGSQYGEPGDRYQAAAQAAIALDGASQVPADPSWCSGSAGDLLARIAADAPYDLDEYLRTAAVRPVLADLSLCHGELGALEPLATLAGQAPAATAVRRRRVGLVLAALQRYGPRCGTPRAVASPGLLTGLSGIGYGLLRLALPAHVPSGLLPERSTGTV